MKLLGGEFDSQKRDIRGLYFRRYEKRLARPSHLFMAIKLVIIISVLQMGKQRLREANTFVKLGNGEPGFESRFA